MLVIVLITAAIASMIVALYCLIYRPLPRINGTMRVKGLRGKVEVIRDRWGIPHIYAENEEDLLLAQGYIHAQDRLWQMEVHRRLASGTLAEIVGGMALEVDRFARVIGFRRAAQADLALVDEQTRCYLEAYSQGENAFIETHRSRLPQEFTLLWHKPAPWSPLDTAALGKFMGWALSCNWESELLRAGLIEILGQERAPELEPPYPEDNPTIIPTGISCQDVAARFLVEYRQVARFLSFGGLGGGSNNWVINGARSITGKPLLANDPHLPPLMPSIWYENHLVGGGLAVTGTSMPGVPGVIFGHSDHIAWRATNAYPDVQDLYVEHFRTTSSGCPEYEFQGEWDKVQVVHEEIRVRGRKGPLVEEVVITRHGPIISGLLGEGDHPWPCVGWATSPAPCSRT